ncbi:MAG: SDR family oxidoreductase [Desulfobacterales bacterium]
MKKSIFITGAASGIGKATAELFSEKGWYVGLFDVNEEDLSKLYSTIGSQNGCMKKVDVTDPEEIEEAVDFFVENTGGKMDVLFNCAGILRMGYHDKIPLDDQKKIVDINFQGILNCIDTCFDVLKQTAGSRIINMSSGSAVYGTPELAVYSATKFAVRGLTEALNIEFEDYDIWVCDVMAPYVNTPMIQSAPQKASSVSLLGVNLSPRQVAEVVWKAANGRKIHWVVSRKLKLLMLLNKMGNTSINRFMIKRLTFSGK